ncbi:MAG: hypothetical protein HN368_04630, partial [Spirochaetales bacterium]|nr:hypothetical protein [Spirochaetales bacterium]
PQPTWTWASGGGGNGQFRYDFTARNGSHTVLQTTALFFTPPDQGTNTAGNGYTITLTVEERDDAGNWSSPATKIINIDTTNAQPPFVSGPDITNDTTPTWTWVTGAEQYPGTYQYQLDGGGWSANTNAEAFTSGTLSDGVHILDVQEFFSAQWKSSSKSVTVDTIGPAAPTVSGAIRTNDEYPTWTWSHDPVDGNGIYQYKFSTSGTWSAATTATSYSPTVGEGAFTLQVQEQDFLGNWSATGSWQTTVDRTDPILNSIILNSGAKYTSSASVTATISAVTAGETGLEMRFYDYNPAGWKPYQAFSSTKAITLPSGDGSKPVYVQIRDDVGNETDYSVNDSIILDTTAPTVTSFALNGGNTYTPSLRAIMNTAGADNNWNVSEVQIKHQVSIGGGSFVTSGWQSYSSAVTTFSDFDKTVGTKYVRVKLRDGALNESGWSSDSINLQIPTLRYAHKGAYSTYSNIYYYSISEPTGSYTNRYYFYYYPITEGNTNVTIPDPNNGGSVYYHTYTENTSSFSLTLPAGQLRYYWVRVYNADSGGWGPFTLTNTLAFASNVTVIYDDDDTPDTSRAINLIKPIIEDDVDLASYVNGTVPNWSVTLLPEDYISNTYSSYNRIYGDPIIITSGTSFVYYSDQWDDRVRNIATSYRGIIGMGYGGGSVLDRIEVNYTAWSLSGQGPMDIGIGESATLASGNQAKTRPATTSDYIWFSPMYYDYLQTYFYNSSTAVAWSSGSVSRRGIYRAGGSTPTGGSIYMGEPSNSNYFPVVRQGRFLFYGFDDPPYFYHWGYPFFINMIAKMDNY